MIDKTILTVLMKYELFYLVILLHSVISYIKKQMYNLSLRFSVYTLKLKPFNIITAVLVN